ncbi:MAG TPA: recombinase family protein [Vicinamibacteria bacterium]|nr:recombinase family protein [Vicinamibacteria bacterium]
MNSLPRRAAMYARVSSHRQQKQSTIQSQVTQLRCRIEEDGHQLLEEHILLDDGYSGSYLDRPGLDRLRDLVRDRAIDLIYIHSPDRLARRYVHQVVLMEEFERFGCQVAFFQQTPSKDPDSQLLVQIQGVIAEYERAKIAERLRRGKLYHARQGAILSWKAPYGYRYVHYEGEPGRWEINEDEAPLIRELFGWLRDEALSVRQATKRLQASPWKTSGRPTLVDLLGPGNPHQ